MERCGDRVAAVTGGVSRIGEAAVREFAGAGASVVIVDLEATKGQALQGALRDAGRWALPAVRPRWSTRRPRPRGCGLLTSRSLRRPRPPGHRCSRGLPPSSPTRLVVTDAVEGVVRVWPSSATDDGPCKGGCPCALGQMEGDIGARASPEQQASFVTGAELVIDGGYSAA